VQQVSASALICWFGVARIHFGDGRDHPARIRAVAAASEMPSTTCRPWPVLLRTLRFDFPEIQPSGQSSVQCRPSKAVQAAIAPISKSMGWAEAAQKIGDGQLIIDNRGPDTNLLALHPARAGRRWACDGRQVLRSSRPVQEPATPNRQGQPNDIGIVARIAEIQSLPASLVPRLSNRLPARSGRSRKSPSTIASAGGSRGGHQGNFAQRQHAAA